MFAQSQAQVQSPRQAATRGAALALGGLAGSSSATAATVLETPKQESRGRLGLGTVSCVQRSPGLQDEREGDALCALDT